MNPMVLALLLGWFPSSTSRDAATAPWLTPLARIAVEHAEIPTYDPDTNCAFVAAGPRVVMIHLGRGNDACVIRTIDVVAAAGLPEQVEGEISHVAVDPRGRGFFAATVIPSERSSMPGRVVFVSTRTARAICAVWVGFQPDGCAFSEDGTRLVVVNEGEPSILPGRPVAVVDPPGSISVIELSSIAACSDLANLRQSASTTYFVAGPDVDANTTRIHPYHARSAGLDLEPESVVVHGSRAYVTFQENSAIGVFDLDARAWRGLVPLAPMSRVLDASDRDGGAHVDATIDAWPMPDQIAVATVPAQDGGERVVLVVANEGDDRGDAFETTSPLADAARIGELRARGRIAATVPATLDRLKVDAHHGDQDGDGVIERPLALGARSVSILDARTLELLGDTGSAFEQWMAQECPTLFNADAKDGAPKLDARSDDAGPEPEGVRTLRHDGRTYAITTLERPGALALIDLTRPCEPRVLGVACVASDGDFAPEGLTIVAPEDSPTGEPLMIVAYEGSGSVVVHRLTLPRHD